MTEANTTQTNPQSSNPQNPSNTSDTGSGGGSPTTTVRPDYVPEQFWDAGTNAVKAAEFTTHIGDLAAFKAQHDARIAALPKDAAGYKIEPPKDYKIPEGFKVDENNPLVAPLRAIAHKHQFSQDAVSELVQAQAEMRAGEIAAYNAAIAAEDAKLGANKTARVTAVRTWLNAAIGEKAANDLLGTDKDAGLLSYSADAIGHLEKLKLAFTSQGGAGINGNGREAPQSPPQTIEQKWYGPRKAS